MLKLPDLTNNCLLFLDMSENSLDFKTYEQTYQAGYSTLSVTVWNHGPDSKSLAELSS